MTGLLRTESILRWTARVVGTLYALLAIGFAVGESIAEPLDVGALRAIDVIALTLAAGTVLGLLLAWRWPILGGVLTLVGLVLPISQTLSFGEFPWWFLAVVVIGLMHIADGLLRRRGIGPPLRRRPQPAI